MTQGLEQIPLWPQRFFNIVSCVVTWMLFLFIQHWRVHPEDFSFSEWWKKDHGRIIAATVITLALVVLKATSKDVDQLLEFLGFKITNSSGIAYGLAIAAFLMGLKPKSKTINNKVDGNGPK